MLFPYEKLTTWWIGFYGGYYTTINAMMKWLYKRNETYIDGFDFKKLPKMDKGEEANRRNTFTDAEVERIVKALDDYIKTGPSQNFRQ